MIILCATHALVVVVLARIAFGFDLLPPLFSIASGFAMSFRAVLASPAPMALRGLVVAAVLLAGSALAFMGLMVAVPVLGHATWHLCRKLIA